MGRKPSGDKLRLLTIFTAVVDAQGFAAAARRLGVSPATVTRAIAELELQLGTRVLTRTTRRLRLTEAGTRYVEACRRILQRLDEADAAIRRQLPSPEGHLTIAAPVALLGCDLPKAVARFVRRFPGIDVTCLFLERDVHMADEHFDLLLSLDGKPSPGREGTRVGELHHVVCASPAYLERHPAPACPADLNGHELVVWAAGATQQQRPALGPREPSFPSGPPRLMTNSLQVAAGFARDGLGLARLPRPTVLDDLLSGTLVELRVDCEPASQPVTLLHRVQQRSHPQVQAFIDIAVEVLRQDAGLGFEG